MNQAQGTGVRSTPKICDLDVDFDSTLRNRVGRSPLQYSERLEFAIATNEIKNSQAIARALPHSRNGATHAAE